MLDLVAQRVERLFCVPEGPRSSLGECLFFSFFFKSLPLLIGPLFFRLSVFRTLFVQRINSTQNEPQQDHPRWRPSIESRVRSLFRTFLVSPFSCFFPPTILARCSRSALRCFVFSFDEKFPSKRTHTDFPRWRARLEHVQRGLERRTRLKLSYNPFSSRRNRFPRWAQATGLALATAQAMCWSACVMRGTEIQSHKVEIRVSFTHIRSTPTSM